LAPGLVVIVVVQKRHAGLEDCRASSVGNIPHWLWWW